ncbi:MAG: phage virion morphogenesis protein [Bacteroidota bacterium]
MKLELSGEDWGKFHQCLTRLIGFNFTGLHQEVGEYMVETTKERFRAGIGPDGTSWKPSIRAREEGGKTMMDSRRLYNSLTYRAGLDQVEIGTNVKYATTHQPDGRDETVIKPKRVKALRFRIAGRWATKKEVRIPKREFLGINDEDRQEIVQIGLERIEEATRK